MGRKEKGTSILKGRQDEEGEPEHEAYPRQPEGVFDWHIVKEIVEMAISSNKAITIEKLRDIPKSRRGDGLPKLRKVKEAWVYKGLLEKVEVLARRRGVEVRKVNPAYTSVIGMLKYAPQHSIDKDVAGAYVIGRRGLGYYEEKIPKNYEKLLEEFQSPGGEPQAREPVNRRKEQMRGRGLSGYKLWRVIRVALTIPVLGKVLARDLSPLKGILVSGEWDKVVRRLVPVSWDGGYGVDKYRLPGSCPHLKRRNTSSPAPNCGFVQFG